MELKISGRATGTTFPPAKSNMKMIHDALVRNNNPDEALPRIVVHLVPEPENKYDSSAIGIYVNTQLHGRILLGHISARGFCPYCDTERSGSGHASYGEKAIEKCPECGTNVTTADNKNLFPLITDPKNRVQASAFFIGGFEGRENLGLYYNVVISEPDSYEQEESVPSILDTKKPIGPKATSPIRGERKDSIISDLDSKF